ncbi:MAG: lantibiotic ABC transporter permease, partial [Lactobacillus sp.]|nr:lantibiotic ABC transporter permease [Lactobacillus sp.]
ISALSITVIFDFIWPIVPWSWQIYLVAFWQKEMSLGSQKVIGLLMLIPLFLTVIFSLLIEKAYRNWQH